MNNILETLRAGRRVEPGGMGNLPPTVAWRGDDRPDGDGRLELLDQTVLPNRVTTRVCTNADEVYAAIRELCVRGAPAIGVAGAYGVCLAAKLLVATAGDDAFRAGVLKAAEYLKSSRPTAVNLAWAIDRITRHAFSTAVDARTGWQALIQESHQIAVEDVEACHGIGRGGAALIRDGGGILTHCNAGALATTAYGTALAPLYVAAGAGKRFRVYADETRPLLQGARLTALELAAAGIDVTVLCDGASASLLASGRVDVVIVGADRIAANGDTANKIGTLSVAIAAKRYGVPFYVAAPFSTFDLSLPSGAGIPIEERSADEIRSFGDGPTVVAGGARCYNPAFDVTPAELIRGFLTPRGLLEPVSAQKIRDFFV